MEKKRTVADVIGAPESWPNSIEFTSPGMPDMQGAIITDVVVSGMQIAVQTQGAPRGETFSVFVIKDRELRERTIRALKPGMEVHAAVSALL